MILQAVPESQACELSRHHTDFPRQSRLVPSSIILKSDAGFE
jgi:hypothetical protein